MAMPTRSALLALLILLMPQAACAQGIMPAGFVDAAMVVEGLALEMRYFGENNFLGARVDGYEQPRCLLTKAAASALAAVQRDLALHGLGLKVFDCYRPARAVSHFVRWARDTADTKRKREFYPDVDKRDLFRLGYIATHSGHSRGSTVDLTLVRRAPAGEGASAEVDMGSPFDLFGPRSWPSDRSVTAVQRANRRQLADAMRRAGFKPHSKEWWHFTLAREPFPASYFDFPVR